VERGRRFIGSHPMLVTWFILAVGMGALFWAASQHEVLTIPQRAGVSVALIVTAGLCARMLHGSKA
jgi:hypothetical protein